MASLHRPHAPLTELSNDFDIGFGGWFPVKAFGLFVSIVRC